MVRITKEEKIEILYYNLNKDKVGSRVSYTNLGKAKVSIVDELLKKHNIDIENEYKYYVERKAKTDEILKNGEIIATGFQTF